MSDLRPELAQHVARRVDRDRNAPNPAATAEGYAGRTV
jgi:hypothetical protein